MLGHFQLFELLRTRWLHLIYAIMVSMAAGAYAGYDAWDQAPLVEPFITPDPADPRIYYDEDARLKVACLLQDRNRRQAQQEAIWLAPYLNLPFRLETRNVMVVGASGHGKSSLIRSYAHQMMRRGDNIILHCNKGDVTQCFDLLDVISDLSGPPRRVGLGYRGRYRWPGCSSGVRKGRHTRVRSTVLVGLGATRPDGRCHRPHGRTGNAMGAGRAFDDATRQSRSELRDRIAKIDLRRQPLARKR